MNPLLFLRKIFNCIDWIKAGDFIYIFSRMNITLHMASSGISIVSNNSHATHIRYRTCLFI